MKNNKFYLFLVMFIKAAMDMINRLCFWKSRHYSLLVLPKPVALAKPVCVSCWDADRPEVTPVSVSQFICCFGLYVREVNVSRHQYFSIFLFKFLFSWNDLRGELRTWHLWKCESDQKICTHLVETLSNSGVQLFSILLSECCLKNRCWTQIQ